MNLGNLVNKAKEKSKSITDEMKKELGDTKNLINNMKSSREPVEGGIIRYSVLYQGGMAKYGKGQNGEIGLNIMTDRFSLMPGAGNDWLEAFDIPYTSVSKFELCKRQVGNWEMVLSNDAASTKALETENSMCIVYDDENGDEIFLRLEMLSGITVYKQAIKCTEMMDILRQNGILKLFKQAKSEKVKSQPVEDPIAQIEKLQGLKEKGIITEDEFNSKKAELLAKL